MFSRTTLQLIEAAAKKKAKGVRGSVNFRFAVSNVSVPSPGPHVGWAQMTAVLDVVMRKDRKIVQKAKYLLQAKRTDLSGDPPFQIVAYTKEDEPRQFQLKRTKTLKPEKVSLFRMPFFYEQIRALFEKAARDAGVFGLHPKEVRGL